MAHSQACLLHNDKQPIQCSGTLRKGGDCLNRAYGSFAPGMLPMCRIHRRQQKRKGRCRAPLHCGFECGRLCEWKLHGTELCLEHREHRITCYFLKIPVEMRLRIYQLLLPDRPIPARYEKSSLASDGGGVYTAILCVNQQIHDEAAGLLYQTRVFSIELHGDWLSMCNLSQNNAQHRCFGFQQHPVEGHQWQQTTLTQTISSNQVQTKSPNVAANLAIEPIWNAPLSNRYFDMIQSFRIEIILPSPNACWLPNPHAASHKASLSRLLDYCDHLHILIGRLRTMQRSISRLDIVFKFGNGYLNREDAFPTAQFLLRPFRRLHNVANPSLLSIAIQDPHGYVELLTPDQAPTPTSTRFGVFLDHLYGLMTSSQPSPELPVFKAYWQLTRLLLYMKEHYRHTDPKIRKIARLLYSARYIREVEDCSGFRAIWNQVVETWTDCLHEYVDFQRNMALSIDAIHGTIQNGL